MTYFKILRKFSNPEPGTHRGWAEIAFLNGLADIIYSIGLAMIIGFLLQGRGGEPMFGSACTIVAMAIAFSFGGSLGIAKWVGAWKIVRHPKNT